jgi:RNA polymerase sigma factor (sigma-70 family)
MVTNRLFKALDYLQAAAAPPESDARLLARFLATRDEAAFATLVRRHGPMVLGVCRRVLRHAQDAEDAFQAAFLVLARKAGSVLKQEAVGSWLYMVAYRTAQRARAGQARRRAREKQMDDMPHPEVRPLESPDWRPLLDDELARLPEKYRAVIVLCDLQGQSRREAARRLNLPEGTLSSRLAAGRKLLAARLARRGVALSGGALAAALSGGAASARVSAPLVLATAKAAAGHLAAVAPAVAVLAQGVLRTMFLTKLKVVVGVALVVVALGAGGIAYRPADAQTVPPPRRAEGKPPSEVETLRKEVELLRLNLLLVLEKVRAQEAELSAFRGQRGALTVDPVVRVWDIPVKGSYAAPKPTTTGQPGYGYSTNPFGGHGAKTDRPPSDPARGMPSTAAPKTTTAGQPGYGGTKTPFGSQGAKKGRATLDAARQAEALVQELRGVMDDASRQRLLDALERVLRRLREQPGRPGYSAPRRDFVPEKQ